VFIWVCFAEIERKFAATRTSHLETLWGEGWFYLTDLALFFLLLLFHRLKVCAAGGGYSGIEHSNLLLFS
jgi:hypothetical protein